MAMGFTWAPSGSTYGVPAPALIHEPIFSDQETVGGKVMEGFLGGELLLPPLLTPPLSLPLTISPTTLLIPESSTIRNNDPGPCYLSSTAPRCTFLHP